MSEDFGSARKWARALLEDAITMGDSVIDATMGNGHDTLWLSERVGEDGHVYAFDIQKSAVESTRNRLSEANTLDRCVLINDGHQNMKKYVTEPVSAVAFNLGWLPGGDKSVTTLTSTTLIALDMAKDLLTVGGIMTICAYPGHEEGSKEKDSVIEWAKSIDYTIYDAQIKAYLNQPNNPPLMIAVRRRK